jgi:fructose-bisphosphate aldolase class II
MIANLNDVLYQALDNKYAVGAFNVYNYETIKAVIEAIRENKTPAIIAFGEKYLANMELKEVANLVRTMTLDLDLPVVLHLDHTKDIDAIKKAIDSGFTSVMYDGSHLSFEENLENTKKVVEYAHRANVTVEAELGSIALGSHSNEDEGVTAYTDPSQAKEFVEKTNVDCLAVSIGTVHGMYKGEPNISVDRLKEIKALVNIPLVLHGGSGTPKATVHECIKNGIAKINVNTEISRQVVSLFNDTITKKPEVHFSQLSVKAVKVAKETIIEHMEMFKVYE